jgi:hypothetical protein
VAGALSGRYRFADGGGAGTDQPFTPGYGTYAASTNPNAVNDPYAAISIAANPPPLQDNQAAADQLAFGQSLRGQGSPTQQYEALRGQRDAAAAQKAKSIQDAMAILQAGKNSQTTSLPMLAAAGAMLAPTRTGAFTESLGNAFSAAGPAIARQRQEDWQQNEAQANLGVEAGSIPLQVSSEDMQDFWKRMQLAEQAQQGAALVGGRTQVSQVNAQAKGDAAAKAAQAHIQAAIIQGGARVDGATIAANRKAWEYKGPDPSTLDKDGNPTPNTQGLYWNSTTNTMNYGPLLDPDSDSGKAAAKQSVKINAARALMADAKQNGRTLSLTDAWAMVNTGVNSDTAYQKLLNDRMKVIQANLKNSSLSSDEIRAMARKQLMEGPPPKVAPDATASPSPSGASPTAPAAPAAAPAAPPAPTRAGTTAPITTEDHVDPVTGQVKARFDPVKRVWYDPVTGKEYPPAGQ